MSPARLRWLKPTPSDRATRRLGPFHLLSVVILGVLLGATVAVTVFAHDVVAGEEDRLLTERVNEVNLVLANSVSTISSNLQVLSRSYQAGGPASFTRDASAQIATSQAPRAVAVLRPVGGGFVVVDPAGRGLTAGQTVSAAPAEAARAAEAGSGMAATGVYRAGGSRALGFALGAPGGVVIYQQVLLGPVQPPAQAGTRPFSEVHVVLYASPRPDPGQVLLATTKSLPLRGAVKYAPLMVGSTRWVTGVKAVQPLVGSVAVAAPWVALTVGAVGSVLVFLVVEGMAWRRDVAVETLQVEHRFAESLQRRLLPTVPPLTGLDVASSYVPGADHQQVGGDWFDVFELPSGQVAVVIGDVMGHDVEAAAIMAQLRSSLRSYATEGGGPAWTLERLAAFVDLFAVPAVATVVYGLLEPPDAGGSRRLSWANAGHLPPLLRLADGRVEELDQGASPLLGAPCTQARPTGERLLPPGCTLLLYTDGLVEVQDQSLGVTVAQLQEVLGRAEQARAEEVCAAILSAQLPSSRRDDVALLVVKVNAEPSAPAGGQERAVSARSDA